MSAIPSANASIYADLDKRTVTSIRDGKTVTTVTKNGKTYTFHSAESATPPGTEGLSRNERRTTSMNEKMATYYNSKWIRYHATGTPITPEEWTKLYEARYGKISEQRKAALRETKKEDLAIAMRKQQAANRAAREAERRKRAAEMEARSMRAQGWSEQRGGGIWFKHHGRDCIWGGECTYRALVWCKSRACGDIYARISVTKDGIALGTDLASGFGKKGEKVLLTFGPLSNGQPSLIDFGYGPF